jgi:hypothetical protein
VALGELEAGVEVALVGGDRGSSVSCGRAFGAASRAAIQWPAATRRASSTGMAATGSKAARASATRPALSSARR